MEKKKLIRYRILINSIHIVIGAYLLTLSDAYKLPDEYKKSEKHGYVLIVLGTLALSQIFNIYKNIKARGGTLKQYFNEMDRDTIYWDLIHIVHILFSGPLLILLGLYKIGKFDYIDEERFRSISLYLGITLILYHLIRSIMHSFELH